MKQYYLLLLTLITVTMGFAYSDTDTLSVAKKTRTFAVEPTPVHKMPNTEKKRIATGVTVKPAVSTTLRSRTFKALDDKISEAYFSYAKRSPEFNREYLANYTAQDSTINEHLAKAVGTFDALDENGNFIETLQPSDLVELPVGIKKSINNVQYILGISSARFTPEYTELVAFMRIILPQQDAEGNQKQLFFGANNVRLSHSGGLLGETNLVLLGNVPIRINGDNGLIVIKGGFDMDTGDVTNRTYVTVDCDGFKELGIEAEVQFPRQMLVPLKDDYTIDNSIDEQTGKEVKVTGQFQAKASDWNDILVEVSLPRFALNSFKEGLAFDINTAIFDFSDLRNDEDIVWPENYQQDYLIPGNEEAWRGVYVKSLTVALPEQFKRKGSEDRIVFKATNLLIDGLGVSATFSADDVLPLNEGNAAKWQFSVDHFEATFVANHLTGAGFGGGIVLPISKKATAEDALTQQQLVNNPEQSNIAGEDTSAHPGLTYTAIINPVNNEYILTASPTKAIKFNIWKATANIASNSYIELKVVDKKFRPKAVLHGSMGIYADKSDAPDGQGDEASTPQKPDEKKTVNFKGVTFQDLQLQTESPIFSVSYFGYKGEVKVAKFPVTISDIALTANNTSATIAFTIAVNLQAKQFNASTRLGIVGKFAEDEGIQKWKYDHLNLEAITIAADIGGAKFDGSITLMNNDPTYGDGFKGNLTAKFKGLGSKEVTVTANAIFGRTTFRYWYVDALADNLSIPAGGAFKIKGFGGGAFYRMKKDGFSPSFSASGAKYVPDDNSGLGIKAMILFSNSANDKVFNGGAGFEIAFNRSGGMNRISIYGEGHVMQAIDIPSPAAKIQGSFASVVQKEAGMSKTVLNKLKETNLVEASKQVYPDNVTGQVGINAYAAIEYDFNKKTLHGSFDLYVDVAGGIFKGRASKNRAGWAVFHFAPDKWYVHMGTPTDRLGLIMSLGPVKIETGGYFMVGHDIPGSPPPPAIVAKILGVDAKELDYMRDENSLGDGRGLAFGADISIDTGDLTFLLFYARFQAGLGFDIMIKDYGDAECAGSGQIGIDGWYANGQAYAYLQGELGINIKLLFVKKKIPIIKGSGAVLLQAKLPNPAWFRGYVGGEFDLLDGLVKGRFNFKLELGEKCDLINGSPLDDIEVIADVTPENADNEVDVFSVPQVGFNMRINKQFRLGGENGDPKTYRIKLEEFKITDEGKEISGKNSWNSDGNLLNFTSTDILPPTTELTLTVKVTFEERIGNNWNVVYKKDGQKAAEERVVKFTTGEAPDYIPLTNIAYCYPVIDQKYVHKNEYNKSFVKLIQGQDYLFELEEGWSQTAYFVTEGASVQANITYDIEENKVLVDLPVLQNQKEYTMSLVTLPPESDINTNIAENYITQDLGQDTEIEVRDVELGGTVTNAEAVEMLVYQFRTSKYSTFGEKIAAKKMTRPLVEIIYSDIHALQVVTAETESFELIELVGNKYTGYEPLIEAEATLEDDYYKNEIHPLVYEGYPLDNNFTVDRDPTVLGVPPKKAVVLATWYESYLEGNSSSSLLKIKLPFRYHLPFYYKKDFLDIKLNIVNTYFYDPIKYKSQIQKYDHIINGIFPYMKPGNYNTNINYTLPGGELTSSNVYTFNKPN